MAKNILIITVDDLNAICTSKDLYPGTVYTPNIDRLMAAGTTFATAETQIALCGPTRASVWTGTNPSDTGIHTNTPYWRYFFSESETLHGILRSDGYDSVGMGKIYHNPPTPGVLFDSWVSLGTLGDGPVYTGPIQQQEDYANTSAAVQFLNDFNPTSDSPFLLSVGIGQPHDSLAPPEYHALYAGGVALPEHVPNDLGDVPQVAYTNTYYPFFPDPPLPTDQWEARVEAYLASVSYADAMVGRILDALDQSGLADDTTIVLWGDNGEHMGDKDIFAKMTLWDEATRVPFVIVDPDHGTPGQVIQQPVEMVDMLPTILDLLGLSSDIPANADGRSLVPLMDSPTSPEWDDAAAFSSVFGSYSIRTEDWRYTRYYDGSEELYDAKNDPHSFTNLASSPAFAATKHELSQRLDAYLTSQSIHIAYPGIDSVSGGNGPDTLMNGHNQVTMAGGGGDDVYLFAPKTTATVIEQPNGGTDWVIFNGKYTLADNVENAYELDAIPSDFTGNALNNLIFGEMQWDTLHGGSGNDTIFAQGGLDSLTGDDGDDYLCGEVGDDVIQGGAGNDTCHGGSGNDTMSGGIGNDTYYVFDVGDKTIENPGEGTDTVLSSITWTLAANVENLTLTDAAAVDGIGNELANVLVGNDAANRLSGLDENDSLIGAGSNDTLNGGNGNDSLDGGNGDDRLIGGAGGDSLIGGAGKDVFVFTAVGDSTPTSRDTIAGFDGAGATAGDIIDLSTLDAVAATPAVDAFVFIGTAAFSAPGQLRVQDDGLGNTRIFGNVNSDLGADFEVLVQDGATMPTAYVVGDFAGVVASTANTPPIVDLNGAGTGTAATLSYIEQQGPTPVAPFATVSDADTATFNSATALLRVSFGGAGTAADRITLGNQGTGAGQIGLSGASITYGGSVIGTSSGGTNGTDLTVSFNTAAGAIPVTPAIVSALIRDILFTNTSDVPPATARTLTVSLVDGGPGAPTTGGAGVTITMVPVNDAPVAQNGSAAGTENQPVTGQLLAADVDGDPLTYALVAGASHGQVLVKANGSFTYTPNANYSGADSFSFKASDGSLNSNIATVALSLVPSLQSPLQLTVSGPKTVKEFAANGTVVATLSAQTAGGGSVPGLTYVLDDDGGGRFAIVGSTIVVNNGVALDFEQASARSVTVHAVGSGGLVSANEQFTVSVIDVNPESVLGTTGDDTIVGGALNDTLNGAGGNDRLDGGGGADRLTGGPGDDTFVVDNPGDQITEAANQGTDTVLSGVTWTLGANLENLTLTGTALNGTGNTLGNVLTGNAADNNLSGFDGNDTLIGGAGNDSLSGGTGTDSVTGDIGNDTLHGGVAADTLAGDVGNDSLLGDGENDSLDGGEGNDSLRGGPGADTLKGGDGNDILHGEEGRDLLVGGNGNDWFVFKKLDASLPSERDTIAGIDGVGVSGGDIINVADIDAVAATTNVDEAFTFIGTKAFTAAGQLRVADDGFGNTLIQGNVNATLTPDFEILVQDGTLLPAQYTAGDFLL